MQPSPSLSQLMKRRRRRCGGVFRTVGGSSSDFAVEYDWPYRSSTGTHAPNISIDASKANEAFFGRSDIEISRFSDSSGSSSSVLEIKTGRRKYSFERDSDTVRVEEAAVRNLATKENVSTRSPSVYSQESEVSPLDDAKGVHRNLRNTGKNAAKRLKPITWPERSSSLAVPKPRSHVEDSFKISDARTSAPKQDQQSVNLEVKLSRSSSTAFESIRDVRSKLGARTRSITSIITEKVSDLKLGEVRPRRAEGGQRDVSKDSDEMGSGNHALGRNVGHGPEAVRRFFSSSKHSGQRRRVY